MARLWSDIGTAIRARLRHIHLAVEPLQAAEIHLRVMGMHMPETGAKLHREDMRTRHAALWGRDSCYLEDADTVLDKISAFFTRHGSAA
jgi:hypothetical protein